MIKNFYRILTELGQRSLIKTFEQNTIVCESVLSMKSEELANFGLKPVMQLR
jgi:hypothetical protein